MLIPLSDIYGRKKVIVWTSLVYYCMTLVSDPTFTQNIYLLYCVLFMASFVALARASAGYINALEFSDEKFGKIVNMVALSMDGFFIIVSSLIFYFAKDILAHVLAVSGIGFATLILT